MDSGLDRSAVAGRPLRLAHAAQEPGIQRRGDPDAGDRHRPQHRGIQRRRRRAAAAAGVRASRTSAVADARWTHASRTSSSRRMISRRGARRSRSSASVVTHQYDGRITVAGTSAPARIATVPDDFWEMAAARPALGRLPAPGQSEVLLSHASSSSGSAGTRISSANRRRWPGARRPSPACCRQAFRADLVAAAVGRQAWDRCDRRLPRHRRPAAAKRHDPAVPGRRRAEARDFDRNRPRRDPDDPRAFGAGESRRAIPPDAADRAVEGKARGWRACGVDGSAGGSRARPAGRLREHREPVPGTGQRAAEGDGDSHRPGRRPRTHGAPVYWSRV